MRTTAILMITGLLLFACSEEKDLCPEGTCQPNGSCSMEDGQPVCTCEAPDEPCENLTCCYLGKHTGEACEENADCPLGLCHKPLFAEAYCSVFCQTQDDCENHAENDDRQMCCVEMEEDFSICMKIAEGYECGDGTGTCGASCTGTLESACAVDYLCLRRSDIDPKAICSSPCATDDDCAVCEWSEDPEANFSCITVSGGKKYCLINDPPPDNTPCTTSRDCPEGQTCTFGGMHTVCANLGALPPGSECDERADPNELSYEERCSGFYCFYGMCSEVCVEDTDCPEDMICEVLRFSNVDDEIKVCMGDKRCMGPADCPKGDSCWPTLCGDGMEGWCSFNEGMDSVGTVCMEN